MGGEKILDFHTPQSKKSFEMMEFIKPHLMNYTNRKHFYI
jgi:hypothetical protein